MISDEDKPNKKPKLRIPLEVLNSLIEQTIDLKKDITEIMNDIRTQLDLHKSRQKYLQKINKNNNKSKNTTQNKKPAPNNNTAQSNEKTIATNHLITDLPTSIGTKVRLQPILKNLKCKRKKIISKVKLKPSETENIKKPNSVKKPQKTVRSISNYKITNSEDNLKTSKNQKLIKNYERILSFPKSLDKLDKTLQSTASEIENGNNLVINNTVGLLQTKVNQKLYRKVKKIDKNLINLSDKVTTRMLPVVSNLKGSLNNFLVVDENKPKLKPIIELPEYADNEKTKCTESKQTLLSKFRYNRNKLNDTKTDVKPIENASKHSNFMVKMNKSDNRTQTQSKELIKPSCNKTIKEIDKELEELEEKAEQRILFAITFNDTNNLFKLNIVDKQNGNILDHMYMNQDQLARLNSANIFEKYSSVYYLSNNIIKPAKVGRKCL
jgi:hypothetical protein